LASNNLSDVAAAATAFANIKQAATTSATGVAELCTDGEAQAKADTGRVLTASNLAALGVSDSLAGLIEAAVQSEMEAASSTVLAVTPGRQHFHPGHPKAGGNLDGSGTPAFASGDYGMGAVTDNGTGDYTVALDTAFADTNYWVATGPPRGNASQPDLVANIRNGETKTTSSLRLHVYETSGGSANDSAEVGMSFWGDYA
jgi:hypothetical protein